LALEAVGVDRDAVGAGSCAERAVAAFIDRERPPRISPENPPLGIADGMRSFSTATTPPMAWLP
jgi:hypothetical protein